MTARTNVTDERLVRFLQVGYVLEAIVEGRSSQYNHLLTRDQSGTSFAQDIFAEAHEESSRHREQLSSLLESLGAESPSSETISRLAGSNYESTPVTIETALYDQLRSEASAYRYYDAVHGRLITELPDLDLSVPPAEVIAVLEKIRLEEQEGIHDVIAAINSLDVQSATRTPNARS